MPEPKCHNCLYFFVPSEQGLSNPDVLETCAAFYPEPIPDEILSGDVPHYGAHPEQLDPDIRYLEATPLISEE